MDNMFDEYISQTILFETGGDKSGAYHEDPDDKGGATKWGISQRAHPNINIKTLTYKEATEIYKNEYYNIYYDSFYSSRVAFKVFDIGVLTGVKPVVKHLQKAARKVSKVKLRIDGRIGPMTEAAVNEAVLINEEWFYAELVKRLGNRLFWIGFKPGNKKYVKGWIKRVNFDLGECETAKEKIRINEKILRGDK